MMTENSMRYAVFNISIKKWISLTLSYSNIDIFICMSIIPVGEYSCCVKVILSLQDNILPRVKYKQPLAEAQPVQHRFIGAQHE